MPRPELVMFTDFEFENILSALLLCLNIINIDTSIHSIAAFQEPITVML